MTKAEYLSGVASIIVGNAVAFALERERGLPTGLLSKHPSEIDLSVEAVQSELDDVEGMEPEAIEERLIFGRRIAEALEALPQEVAP